MKKSFKLSPEQIAARDARRAQFKALWKQVSELPEEKRIELAMKYGFRTVEGRELSICNQLMIAMQIPNASVLGGFQQWKKNGRVVKKGEHGTMIWIPTGKPSSSTAPEAEPQGDEDSDGMRFITGTVFDISQTEEIQTTANA